ncbi:hypothetical protein CJ207_23680, partial [Klebsiella aerogenes]
MSKRIDTTLNIAFRPAITNDASGYCDAHRQQHAGDGWRNYQAGKSRHERGYGRPWEIRRARVLQR